MIIMRLSDGLGNQLFQYAAARSLQKRTGAEIAFLTDAFSSARARSDRPLLLPRLVDCESELLPQASRKAALAVLMHRLLRPRGMAVRHVSGVCHITRSAAFDSRFHRIRDGMLVSGYFQSRQCAADALPAVRKDLSDIFGRQIRTAQSELAALHGEGRKLALHLRLGDYRQIGDGSEALVPLERVRLALQEAGPGVKVLAFTDSPEALAQLDLGVPFTPGAPGTRWAISRG